MGSGVLHFRKAPQKESPRSWLHPTIYPYLSHNPWRIHVCMVYMLTKLGYIDGKCYHIYIYIAYIRSLWVICHCKYFPQDIPYPYRSTPAGPTGQLQLAAGARRQGRLEKDRRRLRAHYHCQGDGGLVTRSSSRLNRDLHGELKAIENEYPESGWSKLGWFLRILRRIRWDWWPLLVFGDLSEPSCRSNSMWHLRGVRGDPTSVKFSVVVCTFMGTLG